MSLAKEKDPNRKKKTITWDENCIREQDKERGTRMKIPEISTPFNYETWDSGSEEDFSSKAERLSQVQQTMREEVVHRLLEIKEDTEKKKLFEEQRKKHYDEYKTIKALKEEGKLSYEE
ncbi:hypothetical protein MACJ_003590 [Theileria orientalis]|uniref:Protein phosphatase inhibitor 2 n=1 Tax=Theileria orientalis TaxID=68886 RepID=A0A976SLI4_THEOR|nr:hypothetical protein MACJ_003590 [Theileria orientalis]